MYTGSLLPVVIVFFLVLLLVGALVVWRSRGWGPGTAHLPLV